MRPTTAACAGGTCLANPLIRIVNPHAVSATSVRLTREYANNPRGCRMVVRIESGTAREMRVAIAYTGSIRIGRPTSCVDAP